MTSATISNHAVPSAARVDPGADPLRLLRFAIYAYFVLWLFEGALRKWVLPSLSGPLLIVRDPVLALIYIEAIRQKAFKINWFTTFIIVVGTLSTVISFGLEKTPPLKVILFGIHTNFLHLPLIFIIPQVLNYSHVRKIGNVVLWLAPPMAALVALQFLSGPTSKWNVGAGGAGKMIETALGRIRPSGTFSFTTGLAEYAVLLAACLVHQLLERKVFSQLAFLLAAPSLLVMVVMSGSRTVFGLVGLVLLAMVAIWVIKPRFLQSSIKVVAIGFLVVTVIGSIGALQTGMDVILARFGDSKDVKEGFFGRFIEEFTTKPLWVLSVAPAGGVGIGMGTNAASSMMYNVVEFHYGESEFDRIIMEMGPYLALPYLISRLGLVVFILGVALQALKKDNNTFPLLLITACASDIIQGQFGQSTVIGFAVLGAGFALAATRKNLENEEDLIVETVRPFARPAIAAPYAARLRKEVEESPNPSFSKTEPPVENSAPFTQNIEPPAEDFEPISAATMAEILPASPPPPPPKKRRRRR